MRDDALFDPERLHDILPGLEVEVEDTLALQHVFLDAFLLLVVFGGVGGRAVYIARTKAVVRLAVVYLRGCSDI